MITINNKFHFLVFILFVFVYSSFLFFGGFGPGDGYGDYLFVKNSDLGIIDNFKLRIVELNSYSRPVSLFFNIFIHSLFGEQFFLYTFTTIFTWYLTIYTIYFCLKFFLEESITRYFLLIGLFPFYSASIFYEPYLVTAYHASILLWSLSLYFYLKFSLNFNIYFKIVSLFLFSLSLLTLEIVLPLIIISILLPYCLRNAIEKKKTLFDLKNLIIFCIPILFISLLFLTYKIILVEMIFSSNKIYGYSGIDLRAFFQGIYYFFSLLFEIPILLTKSILFLNFSKTTIIIILVYFLNNQFFSKSSNFKFLEKINSPSKNIFYFTLFISLILNSLIFIVSSYPAVTYGFYNKMLVCSFITLSILISVILITKKSIFTKFLSFILIFLYVSSTEIQISNFAKSSKLRNLIVGKISKELSNLDSDREVVLFANVPHHLKKNYNNESVFFTTWNLKSHLELYDINNLKEVNLVSHRHLNDQNYNPSHNIMFELDKLKNDENYYYFEMEEGKNNHKFLYFKDKNELILFFSKKKLDNINNHPLILREKIRLKLKRIVKNKLKI